DDNPHASLVVMPWPVYRWMSTADLRALYAYLRAIPPVRNAVPEDVKDGLGLPPFVPFPHRYTDGDVARPLPPVDTPLALLRGLAIQPLATPGAFFRMSIVDQARFARGSYLVNAVAAC